VLTSGPSALLASRRRLALVVLIAVPAIGIAVGLLIFATTVGPPPR